MAYAIFWKPLTRGHLNVIDRKHHRVIREGVERQLSHEPFHETHNRKPLQRPAPLGLEVWELRLGPLNRFRVFYRPGASSRTVEVIAVGVKERNKLTIGGEEITL